MKNPSTYKMANNMITIGNTHTGHHYWVGKVTKNQEFFAGQTFKAPKKGKLKSISIFPEIVVGESEVLMSIFVFDPTSRTWKDKVAETKATVNTKMEKQWLSLEVENLVLESEKQYGFKISCPTGPMVAIAECHWTKKDAYTDGAQWTGSSVNPSGNFHQHFDLSFIAAIENN